MTHPSTIARDSAQHCEAKKHGLRQTQDGIVVSFVLHPNEVPAALQLAQLGTRYMLALVEIGDDEKPITGKEANAPTVAPKPAPDADNAPVRAPSDTRLSKQAGRFCKDLAFQAFLYEQGMAIDRSEASAATAVRLICHVDSRSKILPGTAAAAEWEKLHSKFLASELTA